MRARTGAADEAAAPGWRSLPRNHCHLRDAGTAIWCTWAECRRRGPGSSARRATAACPPATRQGPRRGGATPPSSRTAAATTGRAAVILAAGAAAGRKGSRAAASLGFGACCGQAPELLVIAVADACTTCLQLKRHCPVLSLAGPCGRRSHGGRGRSGGRGRGDAGGRGRGRGREKDDRYEGDSYLHAPLEFADVGVQAGVGVHLQCACCSVGAPLSAVYRDCCCCASRRRSGGGRREQRPDGAWKPAGGRGGRPPVPVQKISEDTWDSWKD